MERIDLSMVRGDTLETTLTFTDADDNVIDITDWTIFFTVKKEEYLTDDDDSEAEISKSETITDGTSGQYTLTIDPEDTEEVDPGLYVYDIQIKKDDGSIQTVVIGNFEIIQDVTKETT